MPPSFYRAHRIVACRREPQDPLFNEQCANFTRAFVSGDLTEERAAQGSHCLSSLPIDQHSPASQSDSTPRWQRCWDEHLPFGAPHRSRSALPFFLPYDVIP
jgi:hypothetical protein